MEHRRLKAVLALAFGAGLAVGLLVSWIWISG